MPASSVFVTGTDTGVGKTRIACALLRALQARGVNAAGFKPVASGAAITAAGLRNDDALALLEASSPGLGYEELNPYCFAPPIAPHLAAAEAGRPIEIAVLDAAHARLAARHSHIVVEGAGGWLVPLDAQRTFADWVAAHRWPVLLVVGIRLGCINHALLSAQAIAARTRLAGWIANCLPPQAAAGDAVIESLRVRLPAPLLGIVPEGADTTQAAAVLAAAVELCFTPSKAAT